MLFRCATGLFLVLTVPQDPEIRTLVVDADSPAKIRIPADTPLRPIRFARDLSTAATVSAPRCAWSKEPA